MNCRDIEPMLLSERDGVLTGAQHATLERHVAACPSCRQLRNDLATALAAFQTDAANVGVPDVEAEWRTLRAQLHGKAARPERKRPGAPLLWFAVPLAAAAALAIAYFGLRPKPPETVVPATEIAQAEFVEAGDPNASTMVYVDKDSGWLVVWATNNDTQSSG